MLATLLVKNGMHLRVLDVYIAGGLSQMTASFISYLSSAGDLLENLKVRKWRGSKIIDDFNVSVTTTCLKLTGFDFSG
eukprot:scaffold14735_cov467-Ochromonas_danica.AAC.1